MCGLNVGLVCYSAALIGLHLVGCRGIGATSLAHRFRLFHLLHSLDKYVFSEGALKPFGVFIYPCGARSHSLSPITGVGSDIRILSSEY